jgi:hypothetical protein
MERIIISAKMLRFLNKTISFTLAVHSAYTTPKTAKTQSRVFIKNDNLNFEDKRYLLKAYFFLP